MFWRITFKYKYFTNFFTIFKLCHFSLVTFVLDNHRDRISLVEPKQFIYAYVKLLHPDISQTFHHIKLWLFSMVTFVLDNHRDRISLVETKKILYAHVKILDRNLSSSHGSHLSNEDLLYELIASHLSNEDSIIWVCFTSFKLGPIRRVWTNQFSRPFTITVNMVVKNSRNRVKIYTCTFIIDDATIS